MTSINIKQVECILIKILHITCLSNALIERSSLDQARSDVLSARESRVGLAGEAKALKDLLNETKNDRKKLI